MRKRLWIAALLAIVLTLAGCEALDDLDATPEASPPGLETPEETPVGTPEASPPAAETPGATMPAETPTEEAEPAETPTEEVEPPEELALGDYGAREELDSYEASSTVIWTPGDMEPGGEEAETPSAQTPAAQTPGAQTPGAETPAPGAGQASGATIVVRTARSEEALAELGLTEQGLVRHTTLTLGEGDGGVAAADREIEFLTVDDRTWVSLEEDVWLEVEGSVRDQIADLEGDYPALDVILALTEEGGLFGGLGAEDDLYLDGTELLSGIEGGTLVGTETIDGIETWHYRYDFDDGLSSADRFQDFEDGTADVWVSPEWNVTVRTVVQATGQRPTLEDVAEEEIERGTLDIESELTRINEPVQVTIPEELADELGVEPPAAGTPEGTPGVTPEGTPTTPEGTPAVTPEGTPGLTPEGTPSPGLAGEGGADLVADWGVPVMPGAADTLERAGIVVYRVDESAEDVLSYYAEELEAAGWEVIDDDPDDNSLTARRPEGGTIEVIAHSQAAGTTVIITEGEVDVVTTP